MGWPWTHTPEGCPTLGLALGVVGLLTLNCDPVPLECAYAGTASGYPRQQIARHQPCAPVAIGEVKTLMIQLLRGVKHLPDNWILHRDLKTRPTCC